MIMVSTMVRVWLCLSFVEIIIWEHDGNGKHPNTTLPDSATTKSDTVDTLLPDKLGLIRDAQANPLKFGNTPA